MVLTAPSGPQGHGEDLTQRGLSRKAWPCLCFTAFRSVAVGKMGHGLPLGHAAASPQQYFMASGSVGSANTQCGLVGRWLRKAPARAGKGVAEQSALSPKHPPPLHHEPCEHSAGRALGSPWCGSSPGPSRAVGHSPHATPARLPRAGPAAAPGPSAQPGPQLPAWDIAGRSSPPEFTSSFWISRC